MKINITSVHFKTDKKLDDFITAKLDKLGTLYTAVIGSDVILKLDKSDSRENKIAEIRLEIPGNDLFVRKQSKSFEEAADNAIEALRKQLVKHKDKLRSK